MILLCAGQRSDKAFDALLLFAALLEGRGQNVAIDARYLPEGCTKNQKYEAVPFLTDPKEITPEAVIVLGAEGVSEESQLLLRALRLAPETPITLLGRFETYQDELTAANRVAYATGTAPATVNMAEFQPISFFDGAVSPLVTRIAAEPEISADGPARVMLYLSHDMLSSDSTLLPVLGVLNHVAGIDLHILTNGRGKDLIRKSSYSALSVFAYGELPPATLATLTDIAVFFGANIPGERMAVFALELFGAGKVVVDCTEPQAFVEAGAPVIAGHPDLQALQNHLMTMVLENRAEIGRRALQSDWLKAFDADSLEARLSLPLPAKAGKPTPAHTVFFPTNGNGLGHAQRCALVAEAMPAKGSDTVFAAFPSCLGLLGARGFSCVPMVSRSADHGEEYANDLVNYLRLLGLLQSGDHLVFDGGYVFDSVYRVISKLQLPATWIRRGLWQASQVHATALERERAFAKVIIPSEAFAELNADYSFGEKLHQVGPIVATDDTRKPAKTRAQLEAHFDRRIDTLVVSMLGGGMASDRASQIQMIADLMERRSNALHLVVAWPNAVVANGLYGWQNTQVVATKNALHLARAADLVVSATGYNSFHEMIYGQIPAIFIPQHAPYLDDQERRARAAADREVASLVMEDELLLLEREVACFLDDGKGETLRANVKALELPAPGNAAAAQIIAEGGAT